MKRLNNIYNKICDIHNINKMYKFIRRNIRNKNSVCRFDKLVNINIKKISDTLYNRNYKFSKYNIFIISEPKFRLIMSENIFDKVINHLVCEYLLNPLSNRLIDTNVATRKGKGSNYAFLKMKEYINTLQRNGEIYVLKIDVKKYFYNIDHEILKNKLLKCIKDKDALNIIFHIIDSTNEKYINEKIISCKNELLNKIQDEKLKEEIKSIPLYSKGKGLPIGNMTSQFLAIFYLNDLDHYVKESLKCKYYIRYMDDIVILDNDKDKLKEYFKIMKDLLKVEKLETNNKSRIYSLKHGVSFLGYNFKYDKRLLIKVNNKTNYRINKHLRYLFYNDYSSYYKSIRSYKGLYMRCNYKEYKLIMENKLYDKYKNLKNDFKESVVIIKSGIFYYTFDNDAYIMNHLLEYKIIDNKVGFPTSNKKAINKLNESRINNVILENNDIITSKFSDNNYVRYLEMVLDKVENDIYIENIMNLVKEIIYKSNKDYDEIYNYLLNFISKDK